MSGLEDQDAKSTARRNKVALLQENDIAALRATMSTAPGRRTIYRILKTTRWDQLSFTGNSETFRNEGMRQVDLLLRSELMRHCRTLYLQMMNENEEGSNA